MNYYHSTPISSTHRSNIYPMKFATLIPSIILVSLLSACSQSTQTSLVKSVKVNETIATGAPGKTPTWAYSGKTGIGTSYQPYLDHDALGQAASSRV